MPTTTRLPEAIREFLAAPRFATIATIGLDGSPHQAVVWYALDGDGDGDRHGDRDADRHGDRDGDTLYINSRRERRWPQNLERDGRINVAVHDHEKLGHWVGLRGRAEVARTGDAAIEDIAAMARRYGGDPNRFKGQDRITFAVRIERTYEYWS